MCLFLHDAQLNCCIKILSAYWPAPAMEINLLAFVPASIPINEPSLCPMTITFENRLSCFKS